MDLFHQAIAANWPLIRFFMDDPVYRAAYRTHVEDLLNTALEPARVSAILRSEQARIAPFVIGAEGETAGRTFAGGPAQFDAALFGANGLIASLHESRRRGAPGARGGAMTRADPLDRARAGPGVRSRWSRPLPAALAQNDRDRPDHRTAGSRSRPAATCSSTGAAIPIGR